MYARALLQPGIGCPSPNLSDSGLFPLAPPRRLCSGLLEVTTPPFREAVIAPNNSLHLFRMTSCKSEKVAEGRGEQELLYCTAQIVFLW